MWSCRRLGGRGKTCTRSGPCGRVSCGFNVHGLGSVPGRCCGLCVGGSRCAWDPQGVSIRSDVAPCVGATVAGDEHGCWCVWKGPGCVLMEALGGLLWVPRPADFNVLLVSRVGGLGGSQGPASGAGSCVASPRLCSGRGPQSPTPVSSRQWIERVVGWLGKVFLQDGPSRPASPEAGSSLRRWRCHVQRFFYRIYASLRIEELFSIIRDFPDSRPAVEDLKYCLERTDQRPQLLVSLKAALETRLLHPGVNTCDIITLYISAIKALRVLDPSMVVLEVACEPIRRYLRTREDTVRQIVAGLTGDSDGTGDLAVELSKTDPASLETGQDSEDDSGEPEDWVPDPVDADPGKSSSKRRSSDIISLLVSIYGSKDLFINEYRSLLADRLLHQFSFSPEREIRNVELLKLRFGEAPMHFCEVMLKDMADSRRINANIREEDEKRPAEEQPPFGVYAVILSSEFWPPFKDEKLEVPEDVREALEVYCRKYEKLKAMRTLSWKHTLGLVTMDVELADRTLSVAVTPVQAVVLLYFQDQASWTLEELSKVVKMPVALLRRRVSVWLQQGVLREEPAGTFSVVEEERPQDRDSMVLIDSDDESDSGMASQADQKEEELLLFWTYIQAMLTNLESLSLERIYSMLRMFVVTGPALAEIDLQELQGFLQRKVRDQQLVYSAGVYRLPKSCG
eukprot:bmy_13872T0